jgi:hypothetical protein
MKLPTWLVVLGAFECVLGAWGLYATGLVVLSGGVRDGAGVAGLVVAAALALASAVAGLLLLRGRVGGVRWSLWVLAPQAVRVAVPGVVWLVSLGWTANLVLYAGRAPQPSGEDLAVKLGGHPLGAHLAVNAVAALPWIGLLLWWRAARARAASKHDAAAV